MTKISLQSNPDLKKLLPTLSSCADHGTSFIRFPWNNCCYCSSIQIIPKSYFEFRKATHILPLQVSSVMCVVGGFDKINTKLYNKTQWTVFVSPHCLLCSQYAVSALGITPVTQSHSYSMLLLILCLCTVYIWIGLVPSVCWELYKQWVSSSLLGYKHDTDTISQSQTVKMIHVTNGLDAHHWNLEN